MLKNKKKLHMNHNQLMLLNQFLNKYNHQNQKVMMKKMMECYGLKNDNKQKNNNNNNN